jgi:hypothetical protein
MRFGLVIRLIRFTVHLQSLCACNYRAIANSLHYVLSLRSLLCLHQSLLGDRSQQCLLHLCSHSYWVVTVPQLTHCSNCPAYNILAQTAQKKNTFLCCCIHCCVHVCLDVHMITTQPLPSNGRCLQNNGCCISAYLAVIA